MHGIGAGNVGVIVGYAVATTEDRLIPIHSTLE